ncbi:MAG TPA: hypothetical protein VFS11_05830 [Gemmatimonadales bacterium]|nr:hypothetical protein [Gemmatimonadales bacterium]
MSQGVPLHPERALAEMRVARRADLRHRCDVLTPSRTRSAGAVATTAYATASTADEAVPCRLALDAPTDAEAGQSPTTAQTGEVRFAYGRAIAAGQRLEITHDLAGVPNPLTVEVVGPTLAYRLATRVKVTVV